MERQEHFFKLITYLLENHPYLIDIDDLHDGAKGEQAVLSAIKEFSGFDYDQNKKLFIKNGKDLCFATELIKLEKIKSIPDLFQSIEYLNGAYLKRLQTMQQAIDIPEWLFTEPEKIQDISRESIMGLLCETYGLKNEKELFVLEEQKQKEIIYDIYRTFTGYVPLRESPGSIAVSMADNPDMKLRYNDFPNFQHNNLLGHIRDMRTVRKNTEQTLKETTPQRIKEIKKLTKEQAKKREQDQELDMDNGDIS